MTGHRPFKQLTESFSEERKTRVTEKVAGLRCEMALAELRLARARSQVELARLLKVKQPAVAKLEKRADIYVSNLRRYVEALGGTLEITARFPDTAVTITNFGALAAPARKVSKQSPARGKARRLGKQKSSSAA